MKRRIFTTSVLMCVMLLTSQSFARRVYVKLASDATAWSSVSQDAENVVMTIPDGSTDFVAHILTNLIKGDEVWVAKGAYTNTGKLALVDDDANGYVYGGITLYGGFAGDETAPSQRALYDKDGNGLVEAWEFVNETNFKGAGNEKSKASGFQMIHLGQGSVLDGVTVSDNYYTGSNQASGGVVAATSTIRNCIVRDLTVEGTGTVNGGGLYVTGGQVESCLFETCASIASGTTACYGGGLQIYGFIDSKAGTPTGYIKNSVIRNCRAGQEVEGVKNNGRGAGLFGKGGVVIENCVIYNNSSTTSGAGFYFHNNGDANKHVNRVIGSTIVNNCGPYSVFPECDFLEIYNTVVWGNSTTDYPNPDGTGYDNTIRLRNTTASTTAFPFFDGFAYNGTIQNPGNIKNSFFTPVLLGAAFNDLSGNADPLFTAPSEFQGVAYGATDLDEIRKANWTLQAGSPLVNAGVNAPSNTNSGADAGSLPAAFSGVDARGFARTEGNFDIGAYEYGAISVGVVDNDKAFFNLFVKDGDLVVKGLEESTIISIYAVNGTLMSSEKVNQAEVTLPLSGNGVYIVILESDSYTYSQKVIF